VRYDAGMDDRMEKRSTGATILAFLRRAHDIWRRVLYFIGI
jgi:hypothetical protein